MVTDTLTWQGLKYSNSGCEMQKNFALLEWHGNALLHSEVSGLIQ